MAAATRSGFPAGVVLHADRETQVTSQKLAAYMRAVTGTVSMGQAAVCWDNAMAQSLWATRTTEYYYRRVFTTRDQAYTGVATWIKDLYNRHRIHTSLGAKSPHRKRTTPSGLDNSRINKPSTTCAQAQLDARGGAASMGLNKSAWCPVLGLVVVGRGEVLSAPRFFLCVGAVHPIRRQCTFSDRV